MSKRILVLCLVTFFSGALGARSTATGDLSTKQARQLITRMAGIELKSGAVRITRMSPVNSSKVDASAEIQTAFRVKKNGEEQWRVVEVRTGPNQWEGIESIAKALKAETDASRCDNLELALAGGTGTDPSVKRARCLIASLLGVQLPSDAVRIKEVSALGVPLTSSPSALIEAVIGIEVRFTKTQKVSWRVAGIRAGSHEWSDPEAILSATNITKAASAHAELESIAKALEDFRSKRGFYVESNSEAVLIDFLSPRYLARVIRLDPWHRPYHYEGTRDHF